MERDKELFLMDLFTDSETDVDPDRKLLRSRQGTSVKDHGPGDYVTTTDFLHRYTYDSHGRVTSETETRNMRMVSNDEPDAEPLTGCFVFETVYEYNNRGQRVHVQEKHTTIPDGEETTVIELDDYYIYDDSGKLIRKTERRNGEELSVTDYIQYTTEFDDTTGERVFRDNDGHIFARRTIVDGISESIDTSSDGYFVIKKKGGLVVEAQQYQWITYDNSEVLSMRHYLAQEGQATLQNDPIDLDTYCDFDLELLFHDDEGSLIRKDTRDGGELKRTFMHEYYHYDEDGLHVRTDTFNSEKGWFVSTVETREGDNIHVRKFSYPDSRVRDGIEEFVGEGVLIYEETFTEEY